MGENLTRDTLSGFKWTYASSGASAVLQIGYTAAMARLLEPADFGLLAMALLFLRFGQYFAEMGVGQALVQKPVLSDADVRTAFTSTLLLGVLVSAIVFTAAPLGAVLFATDDVVAIVRVLALSFVLQGLGITAESLLRRRLRFRALATVGVGSHVFGYMAVGLSAALLGAGVWSLVAAALSQALLASAFALALVRHPTRPLFSWPVIRSLYGFGGRVSVISFLEFLGSSLDTLFIGRYAGQDLLGQYNRGRLLVKLPLDELAKGTTRVLFPAFSLIQAETARLRKAYLSGLRLISVLVVPAAAGMAVAAHELVHVILGPQWDEAAAVLPFLAILVAAGFTSRLAAITCQATANLNPKLLLQVGHVALLSLLLAASVGRGLTAYALSIAVAASVRCVAYLALMRHVIQVTGRDHLRVLGPVLVTAAMTAGAIHGVTMALQGLAPPVALLAAQVLTGLVVLFGALLIAPLGDARRDVHTRLTASGLLSGQGRPARAAHTLLRHGR